MFGSVITNPEDVKKFYFDSSTLEKAKSSNGGWVFHQLLGDCLGLISGERWVKLRKRFEHANFDQPSAQSRIKRALLQAKSQVRDLFLENLGGEDGSIRVSILATTARFPFIYTASIIYGDLNDDDIEELWTLGQLRMSIMRFVLRGGIYRSRVSWILRPQMRTELRTFQRRWHQFNERMAGRLINEMSSKSSIQSLWKRDDVRDPLMQWVVESLICLKNGI